MKVLIIRFSSIGDIVLTSSIIRCMYKQLPNCEIHFLTKYQFCDTVKANPYIHKIHYLDKSFELMIHKLRLENFDYIIDLHKNLRTLRVKIALKKPSVSFNKLNIQKWLLTALKINTLPDKHIVDRNFEAIKTFGVVNDGMGLDYFISPSDEIKSTDIPTSHSMGYIGLVIGAAHNTKKLPMEKLIELCKKMHHPIIVLGGKEDAAIGNELLKIDPIKIYNACGKFSLNESACLVKNAKLIITHDTGLMHIAAAFKKPILSVWGNTIPAFGMTPYFGQKFLEQQPNPFELFEVKNLSCRPCSKIGYANCPKKHFKCMMLQNTNTIVNAAANRLSIKNDI